MPTKHTAEIEKSNTVSEREQSPVWIERSPVAAVVEHVLQENFAKAQHLESLSSESEHPTHEILSAAVIHTTKLAPVLSAVPIKLRPPSISKVKNQYPPVLHEAEPTLFASAQKVEIDMVGEAEVTLQAPEALHSEMLLADHDPVGTDEQYAAPADIKLSQKSDGIYYEQLPNFEDSENTSLRVENNIIGELFGAEAAVNNYEADELYELQEVLTELAVAEIVESVGVSQETAEQSTVFLSVVPENILDGVTEYMQTATPESAEIIESMIVDVATYADTLHALVIQEGFVENEASAELTTQLIDKYTELLETLGIEVDEEIIKSFIALVTSEDYKLSAKFMLVEPYDPLHERDRWSVLGNDLTGLSLLRSEIYQKVAQLAGRSSMSKNAVLQAA